jgi:hypothetical protein
VNYFLKNIVITINWAWIAVFVIFWSYGYYGAVSPQEIGLAWNILISLGFCGLLILFCYLGRAHKKFYEDKFIFQRYELFVSVSFLVIMLTLSTSSLIAPIVNDELSHSVVAKAHAIKLIPFLAEKFVWLNQYLFRDILYLWDLALLALLIGCFYILRRCDFLMRMILIVAAFLICRLILNFMSLNVGPHPPFRLFPLWLSSSILSSSDFSFRLPQFLGLIIFMSLVFKMTRNRLSFLNSWLLALSFGTLPLLWHVAVMPEPSIWTAIIWTLFLLTFISQNNIQLFPWARWFTLISLFTLMRQSAFIALLPIFLAYVFFQFKERRSGIQVDLGRVLLTLSPVLVMTPFLIQSFVYGTPATYVVGEATHITHGDFTPARIWYALNTGIMSHVIYNSLLMPWAVFPFFFWICFWQDQRHLFRCLLIVLFALATVYVFYSITPLLWGNDRYQSEYAVPFACLGLYAISVAVSRFGRLATFGITVFLFTLCLHNIYIYNQRYVLYTHEEAPPVGGISIRSEDIYDYRAALREVKNEGHAGYTYIAGVTYGVLPEIINGFSVWEVIKTNRMLKLPVKRNWLTLDAALVNNSSEIRLVLISDNGQYPKLKYELEEMGWRPWRNFVHPQSGKTIYGIIRGQ